MINEYSSDEAQARYARFWGALPLTPEQQAAQRASIYVEAPAKPLQSYMSGPQSKWLPKPGQSDQDYVSKLKPYLHALAESLPQDELAAVAKEYNDAVTRIEQGGGPQTGQQLREQLAARQTGTGRGIYGDATPEQRAQAVGRFGGRQIEQNGTATVEPLSDGRPASAAEINMIMREREAARQGQQPQHTDLSGLQSSGEGWITR